MLTDLYALALAALTAFAPPEHHAFAERPRVTQARYEAVARDIAAVVAEADGERVEGAELEVALLASVAAYESALAARVDDCRSGRGGAWSLWQLTATSRHPRAVLCASRRVAAAWALVEVRESFAVCYALPFADRLGLYTDGRCRRGWWRSRSRVGRAVAFLARGDAAS